METRVETTRRYVTLAAVSVASLFLAMLMFALGAAFTIFAAVAQ